MFFVSSVTKRRQRSVDLDYRWCRLTVDKVCNRCQRWPIHSLGYLGCQGDLETKFMDTVNITYFTNIAEVMALTCYYKNYRFKARADAGGVGASFIVSDNFT